MPRPALLALQLLLAGAALLLGSCGGGGGGGVGSNGTGISRGTINGFGSVIVDGIRYDDSSALVEIESFGSSDSYERAETRLGQRVLVQSVGAADDTATSRGVASRLELDPALVGNVTNKGVSTFEVLGQTVDVVDTPGAAPVTVFGTDYPRGLLDIAIGDRVEVHAVRSGIADEPIIYTATRIDKKAAGDGAVRISGVVRLHDATARTFVLRNLLVNYRDAARFPSGTTLADGDQVSVFGTVSTSASQLLLTATKLRKPGLPARRSVDDEYLTGIARYSGTGNTMQVDDLQVDISGLPTAERPTSAVTGSYVRLKGVFDTTGIFLATRLDLRRSDDDDAAELHGTVESYIAATDTLAGSLTVRNVSVVVPAGFVIDDSCGTPASLTNGLFVEVKGRMQGVGLVATRIKCELEVPGSSVVSRTGAINAVDAASDRFTLSVTGSTTNLTVVYSSVTTFVGTDREAMSFSTGEATLLTHAGAVKVEGRLNGTTLTAQKVRFGSF